MLIKTTPWDTKTFGISTYELLDYSVDALQQCLKVSGHYTLKVDPLLDKKLLQEFDFYYCDSLIEPSCTAEKLHIYNHPHLSISKQFNKNKLMLICDGAFHYGRFHRDFNISSSLANKRYINWLDQMIDDENVYGLYWQNELAGFIAYQGNNLTLHAIGEDYRGKGFSKYWWGKVSSEILTDGNKTVRSSISATNLAALNLYASLGFSFENPKDVYHRVVP